MNITDIILDFDGTCTQIPLIYKEYSSLYLSELNKTLTDRQQISADVWENAQTEVRKHSPMAGWEPSTTPAAPAAADPYILSGEAAKYVFKYHLQIATTPPIAPFVNAYAAHPAPWRVEALDVIKELLSRGISVHFVSNSMTQMIQQRMQDLWGGETLPATINFFGSASKYNINEPDWKDKATWPEALSSAYDQVPAVQPSVNIGRPLYLRRGSFASIIATLFKDHPEKLASSLFCGDIWELDLALPAAMGASTHLIGRASPFDTYEYERVLTLANPAKGKTSDDLTGLLNWL